MGSLPLVSYPTASRHIFPRALSNFFLHVCGVSNRRPPGTYQLSTASPILPPQPRGSQEPRPPLSFPQAQVPIAGLPMAGPVFAPFNSDNSQTSSDLPPHPWTPAGAAYFKLVVNGIEVTDPELRARLRRQIDEERAARALRGTLVFSPPQNPADSASEVAGIGTSSEDSRGVSRP